MESVFGFSDLVMEDARIKWKILRMEWKTIFHTNNSVVCIAHAI